MSSGTIENIKKTVGFTTLASDSYGEIQYAVLPSLGLLWVVFTSGATAWTSSDYHDLSGTLPSDIVPLVTVASITRKSGFVTVKATGEVQCRLMKSQTWDLGYACVPYTS